MKVPAVLTSRRPWRPSWQSRPRLRWRGRSQPDNQSLCSRATSARRRFLAALVLRRSGVSLQNIFHNLEEEHFERMTCCLAEIRRSGLEILDGPPPQADLGAAFFGGPLYAVLRRQPPQGEVMTEKQRRIIAVWEEIERADEDISTECLLAQTAHRMTERGCYTTEEQVVEALQAEHQEKMLVRKAER